MIVISRFQPFLDGFLENPSFKKVRSGRAGVGQEGIVPGLPFG